MDSTTPNNIHNPNDYDEDDRPQTADVKSAQNTLFSDLGLNSDLIEAIAKVGFRRPSPVQCSTIPHVLDGQHIMVRAKNGTGKTGAYVIPLLHCIDITKKLQAVIVTSSQELVTQVADFIRKIGNTLGVRVLASSASTMYKESMMKLHSTHILVCTSGRYLSLSQASRHLFNGVRYAVVDEVDAVCAVSQQSFLSSFFTSVPVKCTKMLFSATYPVQLQAELEQVQHLMPNYQRIVPNNQLALIGITQHYVVASELEKVKALRHLLALLNIDQCIIFTSTDHRAELIAKLLTTKWDLPCCAVTNTHKDLRQTVYREFREGKFHFLTTANIGSRGIDIQSVNVVINFDIPLRSNDFLQRTGRAGRFGHLGLAVSLITPEQRQNAINIQNDLGITMTRLPQILDHSVYSSPLAGHQRAPVPKEQPKEQSQDQQSQAQQQRQQQLQQQRQQR